MKKIMFVVGLLISAHCTAVKINESGVGEALLIPYYSVNNGLNTLVSVSNTSYQFKALKINIREGLNGYAVSSYNVYLRGFTSWSFALTEKSSTIEGYQGQDSAVQFSSSEACAPLIRKTTGQEFVPSNLSDGPQNMQRAREGFIEIIEMGVIESLGTDLFDCYQLGQQWEEGGVWHAESGGNPRQGLSAPTGGLMAQADLIDVGRGTNYSIPVTALGGFLPDGQVAHVAPFDSSLSLDAASPYARIKSNHKTYDLSFDNGIDAVSAVLMSNELIGTFALDAGVAGKSEIVYAQPTRRFYVSESGSSNQGPYTSNNNSLDCSDEQYGGTGIDLQIYDRESQSQVSGLNCPSGAPAPAICGSVFVHAMKLGSASHEAPLITGSKNTSFLYAGLDQATDNGFVSTKFNTNGYLTGVDMESGQPIQLKGLPILGVSLSQFTNGAAGPGLLAQYGSANQVSSRITVEEDNSSFVAQSAESSSLACIN